MYIQFYSTVSNGSSSVGNGIRTNYQTASFVVGLRDYVVQFGFGGLMI